MASSIVKLGLALNNSAFLGSGGAPAPLLPKFRTALLASIAGTGRTTIAMTGDSTTAGVGATYAQAVPALIGGLYKSQLALPDMGQSMFGCGIGQVSNTNYIIYNSAISGSFGGSSGLSVGGNLISESPNNVTLVSYAGTSYDTIEFWYPVTVSGGSATVKMKLDATTIATVNQTSVTEGAGHTKASGTAGVPLIETGASGATFSIGFWAYDAANNGCAVLNMGYSGATVSAWLDVSHAYSPVGMLAIIPRNLQTICLGINDWNTAVPLATYSANLQTFINNAIAAGSDVMLIGPNRTPISAGISLATQNTYIAAMQAVATSNNLAFFDIGSISGFSSWEIADANGWMNEGTPDHPNATGYGIIAPAIYTAIQHAAGF